MLSLIYGRPGTGKSYEAVKYHILPNLKKGTLVVTNIPVHVDNPNLVYIEDIALSDVIPIVDEAEREVIFVIDEFQFAARENDEGWFQLFAQHRKFHTDFFIITQSPLSIPEKLRDLVSFSHKTTHNPLFLKNKTYIKKVYDGIPSRFRSVTLNSRLRLYDKKVFSLYDSFYKKNYLETGNVVYADINSSMMFWPFIAIFLVASVVLNFSVEKEFSVGSYLNHSKEPEGQDAEEAPIWLPEPPQAGEDFLTEAPPDTISNTPAVVIPKDAMPVSHPSKPSKDGALIRLLFSSPVSIGGWHFENENRISYIDIMESGKNIRLKSDNPIFENVELYFYEECVAKLAYNSKDRIISCQE
ncbi:Zonular occludens toxin [Grimontia kaedaensis]|uniref:Zonular occludens toxin n=1 Tax=Grimontia kaedaensis TaxID=2872157 RepID=A0ABY4X2M1_9GAMM|nr:zonular occludens toxin domain-containing protein [Grimontia kaedaensis]USH05456.1 Zonular occludens toxin [Grimontia kaedaensis]